MAYIQLKNIIGTERKVSLTAAASVLSVASLSDNAQAGSVAITARPSPINEIFVFRDREQCSFIPTTGSISGHVDALCDQLSPADVLSIHSVLLSGNFINDTIETLFPSKLRLRADSPRINTFDAAKLIDRVLATNSESANLSQAAALYIRLLLTEALTKFGIYTKVPVVYTVMRNESRYSAINVSDLHAAILRSKVKSATATFIESFKKVTVDTTGYLTVTIHAAELASLFTSLATNLFFAVERVSHFDDVMRAVKAYVTGAITQFDEPYHAFVTSPPVASLARIKQVVDYAIELDDSRAFAIHHSVAVLAASDIYSALTTDSVIEKISLQEWLAPFNVDQYEHSVVLSEVTPTRVPASKLFYTVPDTIFANASRFIAPARENDYAVVSGLNGASVPALKKASDDLSRAVSDAVSSVVDTYSTGGRLKAKVVVDRLNSVTRGALASVLACALGASRLVVRQDGSWAVAYFITGESLVDEVRVTVDVKYGITTFEPEYVFLMRASSRKGTRPVQIQPVVKDGFLETALLHNESYGDLELEEFNSSLQLGVTEGDTRVGIPAIPSLFTSTKVKLSMIREQFARDIVAKFAQAVEDIRSFSVLDSTDDEDDDTYRGALGGVHDTLLMVAGNILGNVISQSKYANERARAALIAFNKAAGINGAESELAYADKLRVINIVVTCFTKELSILAGKEASTVFEEAFAELSQYSVFTNSLLMTASGIVKI